jgi:hypothetical protein
MATRIDQNFDELVYLLSSALISGALVVPQFIIQWNGPVRVFCIT